MKKSIQYFLVGALMMGAHLSFSQAQFAVGIKAGPNFAKINWDQSASDNYKSRAGFHAGAFALIKVSKIGIQPEVLFSQQGSKVKINTQDYDANYSYINIPIIVKLYTVAGINIQAGPQFGFLSSAKNPVSNGTTVTVQDVKSYCKSSDISAALGLGWDLPFGLTIDARYNLGLSKIYKNSAFGSGTPNAKNQVIQVSLGYKIFKFGK